jgi:signal transduction histidine kinase/FixJ family two-component response regulator
MEDLLQEKFLWWILMKPNRKSPSLSINWQQMPLLRTLVLVQIGIAIVFSIISMFVVYYYVNERATTALNSRKLDLIRIMSPNQEKIRLWAILGMDEALLISLQDIKKIEFINDVKVRSLTADQLSKLKEEKYILTIPENVDLKLPVYLIFKIDQTSNSTIFSTLLIPLLVFVFTFILIYFSIVFIMKKFFKPLSLLISDDDDSAQNLSESEIEASGEIAVLISKIQISQQIKILHESEKNNFKLATQLAHDIRSPLEVLKSLRNEMSTLPETTRKGLQLSISRIEEITLNLLQSHKLILGFPESLRAEDIVSLVSSIVVEKKIEFRNFPQVEIIQIINSTAFTAYSKIQKGAIKSILSNLINNGFDSFNGLKGKIFLSVISMNGFSVVSVQDNGPGIPLEVKDKLFVKGFTTKKTGNGLGLYNAKLDIEALGGSIVCESDVGKGTTFRITLPSCEPPSTFIDTLETKKYDRIIVLDDDPAFHDVWSRRLEGVECEIEHVHSVEEMLTKYNVLNPKILLLSDFELMDKHYDGIDTILKLNHVEHSVLVTARSDEATIQDRCLAAGIKLLSKSLVNCVKVNAYRSETERTAGEAYGVFVEGGISRIGNTQPPIILIDDDKLIHLNWASYCKKHALQFQGFKSVDDFLKVESTLDKASRIFIDSSLGDGIKGEAESEKIFHLGFFNLYLATGYEKNSILKPSWIKDIFSKSPENIG